MRLGFHPDAVAELRAAAFWYDERRAGLGDEFIDDVKRLGRQIADSPATFATWAGWSGSHPAIRRALLDRFPYAVAFEIREHEIIILAVAHAKRRPLYWARRAGQGRA